MLISNTMGIKSDTIADLLADEDMPTASRVKGCATCNWFLLVTL